MFTLYGALFPCYHLIRDVTSPGGNFVLLKLCCVCKCVDVVMGEFVVFGE